MTGNKKSVLAAADKEKCHTKNCIVQWRLLSNQTKSFQF
jgi:hypothetical protein